MTPATSRMMPLQPAKPSRSPTKAVVTIAVISGADPRAIASTVPRARPRYLSIRAKRQRRGTTTDAPPHGHGAPGGTPTAGRNAAATIAAPIEIKTVVASGSSPALIVAFQPAWQAA